MSNPSEKSESPKTGGSLGERVHPRGGHVFMIHVPVLLDAAGVKPSFKLHRGLYSFYCRSLRTKADCVEAEGVFSIDYIQHPALSFIVNYRLDQPNVSFSYVHGGVNPSIMDIPLVPWMATTLSQAQKEMDERETSPYAHEQALLAKSLHEVFIASSARKQEGS